MGTLIHFPVRPAPEQSRPTTGSRTSGLSSSAPARESAARDDVLAAPGAVDLGADDPATVDPRSDPSARSTGPALLWREAVGHELRLERTDQARTLADVARRAGVSTQYLSEIERGRKEPSSEVLEAVGAALSLTLLDLTSRVSGMLARSAEAGPRLMAA